MADQLAGLILFVGLPVLGICVITWIWGLVWPEERRDAKKRNQARRVR